jgi:hypothetical protein
MTCVIHLTHLTHFTFDGLIFCPTPVGMNSTNIDLFICVGHTLNHVGYAHMGLFGGKWTNCCLLQTSGFVDLH